MSGAELLLVDFLGLTGVAGLGDEGLAHVWHRLRTTGDAVSDLYKCGPERLQRDFGFSGGSAKYLCEHAGELRRLGESLRRQVQEFGIIVLTPGQENYPAAIESLYNDEPPLLYARGNLNLLGSRTVAVVNSAEVPSESLGHTLALASRLAEGGMTLVTGTQNPAYNVVGLAAKRAGGDVILVPHQGLITAMNGQPGRELAPLARQASENFDSERTLLISPFRLDGIWQKGNGARRDRLLFGLAHIIVGIAIRKGGVMDSLSREALSSGRLVFASQESVFGNHNSGNGALISEGAVPLVLDSVASNCDLILRLNTTSNSAQPTDRELERRREIGQFFTPVTVARFMWSFLEGIEGRTFRKGTRVVDPACGEGVFIGVAADQGGLAADTLTGVDIDENLVPVWRKDPLVSGARLFRTNGLVDNRSIGLQTRTFDVVIGNPPFSGKGMRDLLSLTDTAPTRQQTCEFDFFKDESPEKETARGSTECRGYEQPILDWLVRQLSRYECWRLNISMEDEGSPSLETNPQDVFAEFNFSDDRRPVASDYERMAKLIASWAADQPLDVAKPELRDTIRRLASTAIEVFFTERFVQLAKPGGLIAVIVPQSIVASNQLAPFRSWLLQQIELLAVIGLPRKVFTGVGANANTSILFGRRLGDAKGDHTARASGRKILLAEPERDSGEPELNDYFRRILASDFLGGS